jgi:cytochrome c oxidase cbb3-type subunit 3
MSHRARFRSASLGAWAGSILLLGAGCKQENRDFRETPPAASASEAVRVGELQPGGVQTFDSTITKYDANAYAVGSGQRLYNQMNCVGCHFHGGGGIGPALMDDQWVYGSDPAQIFKTIVEGRPNGMPSFKGKLTNQQVWQLVTYVRSLSGLGGASSVSSAREDHMYLSPDLAIRSPEKPTRSAPRP